MAASPWSSKSFFVSPASSIARCAPHARYSAGDFFGSPGLLPKSIGGSLADTNDCGFSSNAHESCLDSFFLTAIVQGQSCQGKWQITWLRQNQKSEARETSKLTSLSRTGGKARRRGRKGKRMTSWAAWGIGISVFTPVTPFARIVSSEAASPLLSQVEMG